MTKVTKGILWIVCGILMAFGLMMIAFFTKRIYDEIHYAGKRVPVHVRTISAFRKWQPSYVNTVRIEVRGSVYYIIKGDEARSVASAESEYYFDSNGNYLGWCEDAGDFSRLAVIDNKDAHSASANIAEIGNQ